MSRQAPQNLIPWNLRIASRAHIGSCHFFG